MIPEWAKLLPWNLITIAAKAAEVDVNLIAAIVMQESAGKSWVTRYEQDFAYLYNPSAFAQLRGVTEITEIQHQKTSWGLMQVMGAVAREVGYSSDLTELARPPVGLRWGCEKFKANVAKYGMRNIEDIVAAWNAGSPRKDASGQYVNQRYVIGVLRLYNQIAPQGA